MKKYYKEINIARGIGVLVVLLGHSFPDAEIGVFAHPIYQWGFDFCYSFHMALFFVISGFVMGKGFWQDEYFLKQEIVKKMRRLLIPYLFLAYLSLLPKIILNAYARNPVDTSSALRVLFGQSPNGSLWYLYTLFVFSVFTLGFDKVFRRYGEKVKTAGMAICGIFCYALHLYIGDGTLSVFFMDKICKYLIFYVLGLLVCRYYEVIRKKYNLMMAGIMLVANFGLESPYLSIRVDYMITAILGSYGILVIANKIAEKKDRKLYAILDKCGEHSYDIYILSYYVQQTIRVVFFRIWGWNYSVVFLMELGLGFVVSYLFSVYILRKSKMLKVLLIGVWEKSGT